MGAAFVSLFASLFMVLFFVASLLALISMAWRIVSETSQLSNDGAQELMDLCAQNREVDEYRIEIVNSGRDLLNIDLQVAQNWVHAAPQRRVVQPSSVAG